MGIGKTWTSEELDYLQDSWGTVSIPYIANKLNRSINAIKLKAQKLQLGSFLESGSYITLNQFFLAIRGRPVGEDDNISFIKNRGLPVKYKRAVNEKVRVIYLDDFWKWAKENRAFIDFSKFEENMLGEEPDWAKTQRKADVLKAVTVNTSPWTAREDEYLKSLLKQHKYTVAELTKFLRRTNGAIQRRIIDLGLRERPVKADNHNQWTDAEFEKLDKMILRGYSYVLMAEKLPGRSDKAIRGRVYCLYGSENLDKVKAKAVVGWKAALEENAKRKAEKALQKQLVSKLIYLLKVRFNELNFDGFWQKDMCLHWDNIDGCKANEKDCDSCVSYRKIPEQYCVRCGATVISRTKILRCERCIKSRRRQHFKKLKALGWSLLELDEAKVQ